MLNGLDLFSGIGGLSLALNQWVRPIAYCEIDPYCQGILLNQMASGGLETAPIWDDVRTFPGKKFVGKGVDIIYGGFPCQDISVAGHGKGLEGERSGLYWEIYRLCMEIRPKFIFLENTPNILSRGGTAIVDSLAKIGYDCRWTCLSAAQVGAKHKRDRWWLLAYANGKSTRSEKEERETKRKTIPSSRLCGFWEPQPNLDRVAHGIPFRMDRAKSLGNAVVPECAKKAFEILMGISIDSKSPIA